MMRVLIVEDEAPAHRRLRRLVQATRGYEQSLIEVAESLRDAQRLLDGATWDVVLLDLDLSGRDGFELVGRFPSASPTQIIVVSAYPQRAIEAFEHAVVDFVRKPVSASRLAQALGRVRREPVGEGRPPLVGTVELVRLERVLCASGADDYVELHLHDGRRVLYDSSLDEIEGQCGADFVRVHRSHLVNLRHVVRLISADAESRQIELTGGVTVPVSRRRYGMVEERVRSFPAER
jgi:two-component system, LytTR family, response regulator LytT